MGKYFGTDGFRGEANVNLLPNHAYQIGRFLGWYYGARLGKRCRIVIGKDTRRSGYMLESALSSGIICSGGDVYMMWVTTTPSVSYITRTEGFDCGVMISASHNPFYDNGIKLLNSRGEKMDEETICQIEAYMDGETQPIPMANRENIGSQFDFEAGRNRYTGYLISQGIYNFRGIKVGLDCANGSAWRIAQNVFNALGAEVTIMGNQPNGTNINDGVGSTHIEGLQALVRDNHLDVGFAYDGDADRCMCVDEKGNVVNGDLILYIYGRYMKERGHLLTNTVVTTVMSNFGLYKAFDEIGIDYAKTDVGDKYVYEYMATHGCRLGGEQSGHIIFSKYATTGDGILTSLKMMQAMIGSKKTLSELAAPVKIYPQKLENVRVKSKPEAQNDPEVQAAVQAVADELGDSGRILVRESGTEPLIRVMVEAETQEQCDAYVKRVTDVIIARGHQAG
ncbi:MAG: phosphoglucosamine mutase [Clostridiales bacterium]|nr:phosphoglucosamine mutase [Clostridiales bacterium]